jgi:Mn2+/Fe2+ NRAMP family transporter
MSDNPQGQVDKYFVTTCSPRPMTSEPSTPSPAASVVTAQAPPTTFWGILSRLGPGLIIAGSIVGSGELIGTTKTGAQAGMSLLWLILVGCVIKVFAQIELGRYTIVHGQTTLAALNSLPGPRLRVNWVVGFWIAMTLSTLFQLGGIVGGVGQSLAIALPLRGDYRTAIALPSEAELVHYVQWRKRLAEMPEQERIARRDELRRVENHQAFLEGMLRRAAPSASDSAGGAEQGEHAIVSLVSQLEEAKSELAEARRRGDSTVTLAQLHYDEAKAQVAAKLNPSTSDDKMWAAMITAITIGLLYRGRYRIVESLATALVVVFTLMTVGNVFALQTKPEFHLNMGDFLRGFSLPESKGAVFTALATFGIIGVGASELVQYPYWCVEKGYARFTGPRSDRPSWAERARGWMKVMHYDALLSMVIYTVATLAFYLMGVAVLHRSNLDPDGMRMVSTLLEQYRPVFGTYAQLLFLTGAFAVLYSTFLVATAGHSRTFTDCFKLLGWLDPHDKNAHRRSVSAVCVGVPLVALCIFASGMNPVTLVFIGATMQALMLPVLGYAALYFRYKRMDERLRPSRLWDTCLVISCIGLAVAGGWLVIDQITKKWFAS